jgi:hypothetical protein
VSARVPIVTTKSEFSVLNSRSCFGHWFGGLLEDEEDGRAIIQSFIDKMEGMIVGARQAHYAFGNPTLVRYLRAQLSILRDELERLQVPFRKRGAG